MPVDNLTEIRVTGDIVVNYIGIGDKGKTKVQLKIFLLGFPFAIRCKYYKVGWLTYVY